MIQLSNLTKSFGERILLDSVTWTVADGDRVGLCGPNGAGKTTLLRMLAGIDEPDAGAIITPSDLTVGYLPQDGLTHGGRSLLDEASLAFAPLLEARAEIDRIENALADPALPDGEHEPLLVRYHDLTDFYRRHEGHSIELRVTQVLDGLGFARADFGRPVETFSGGWQMRVALAKLLLGRPTLLLLDEPTNHLDLEARNWLEGYLETYPHAVILVSHDRFFLDAVVTRIADISLRTITDYVGNYSRYLAARDANLERLRKAKRGAGRGGRPPAGLHRSLPLPGDESRAGAEPHQDARQDRADRGAAGAQAGALHLPGLPQERPHRARTARHRQGLRRPRRPRITSTCTSSGATASPWWRRTARASPR